MCSLPALSSEPLRPVSSYLSDSVRDKLTQHEQRFLLAVREDDAKAVTELVDPSFPAAVINGALRLAVDEASIYCLAKLLSSHIGADPHSLPPGLFFEDLEVIDCLMGKYHFSTQQLSNLLAIWIDHNETELITKHLGSGVDLLELLPHFYTADDAVFPNPYSSLPSYSQYLQQLGGELLPEKMIRLKLVTAQDILSTNASYGQTQDDFIAAAENALSPEEFADPEIQGHLFAVRSLHALNPVASLLALRNWFEFADVYSSRLSVDLFSDAPQKAMAALSARLRAKRLSASVEILTLLRIWKALSAFADGACNLLPTPDLLQILQLSTTDLRPETYLVLSWLRRPEDIDKVVAKLPDPDQVSDSVTSEDHKLCKQLDAQNTNREMLVLQLVSNALGRQLKSASLL